jgi:shikimate dehydrogenase
VAYLDDFDESVEMIGAVNTIVNDHGHLKGYNTDWYGVERALLKQMDLTDKKVVVIGAGGVASAIIYALKKHTKHITLYNRTAEKGLDLAKKYGIDYKGDLSLLGRDSSSAYDLLINATSIGFKSKDSPLNRSQLLSDKVVLDLVFTPVDTKFLEQAKKAKCKIIEGYQVSLYQACYQFELYTGYSAPVEVMKKALMAYIQ